MIAIDNYVEDWEITNEDAAGRPMTVAIVELNSAGVRNLAGLFPGDRVEFSMVRWIVHEIRARKTLLLRAAAATDPY